MLSVDLTIAGAGAGRSVSSQQKRDRVSQNSHLWTFGKIIRYII